MAAENDISVNTAEQRRERLRELLLEKVKQPEKVAASCAQRRLWLVDQLEQPNASYNNPCHITIRGCLDISLLEQSINRLIARHSVLRTRIIDEEGKPFQSISRELVVTLTYVDITSVDHSDRKQKIADIVAEESAFIFDLATAPLFRVKLLHSFQAYESANNEDEYVLIIVLHHIISDGWSIGVMARDLFAIYNELKNNDNRVKPLPLQYSGFSRRQFQWLKSDDYQRQLSYWKKQLRDLPIFELRTDFSRPSEKHFKGANLFSRIDASLVKQLKTLCEQQSVTLSMLLTASFSLLLHRYTGQKDVVFGSPIANRNQADIENLIGFFANMQVIRNQVEAADSFFELLAKTRQTLIEAYSNQDLPFEDLVDVLQPVRDRRRNPLFQILFAMQNEVMPFSELEGLTIGRPVVPGYDDSEYEVTTQVTRFDIELHCWEDEKGIRCSWVYDTDLFDSASIRQMRQHFANLLAAIVAEPGKPIDLLPLMGDQERAQIVNKLNQAKIDIPRNLSVHELFEQQVAAFPDNMAVEYEGKVLSYAQLNEQANQLAHFLRAKGVGPEVIVGVCLERSLEMLVALVGILKAGGAYLPLDPDYPQFRLNFMLEDAEVPVIVTTSALRAHFESFSGRTICLDREWTAITKENTNNPVSGVTADNLAYVIYTSGSTGRPKGVMVSHGNVTRLFAATEQWYGFDQRDVWTLFHSSAFDFSEWEIWGALLHGGRLVVVPYATSRSPELFYDLLVGAGVTVLNQTPSAFYQLMKADETRTVESLSALRLVIFGGEALNPQSLGPWFEKHGDRQPQLVNMYGITETTVHVTYRPLVSSMATRGASLIGRAIPDLQIYILDRHRQPVPIGVPGEMYIGGAGLARGYLNRPELTAERFIEHPFSDRPGARLYRTGDLARYLVDGDIEFLGRIDHQVKLRGFRIELGEIEAVLARHASIRDALVIVREDEAGDKQLVAYVVPALEWMEQKPQAQDGVLAEPPGEERSHGELIPALRQQVREQLPDYMVPSVFVVLDEFPLNANGKLDRQALPDPDDKHVGLETRYTAPRNEFEQRLAGIWADVLQLETVGIHDNFFDLGGHSLKMTQVVSRLRQQLNIELPLSQMFSYPTVAGLGPIVESLLDKSHVEEAAIIKVADRAGDLPLSFAQQRLWFLDQLEPDSIAYNIPLALRLKGELDLAGLIDSLNAIVRRHEALRTRFVKNRSGPVQIIDDKPRFKLAQINLLGVAAEDLEQEIISRFRAEKEQAFDLAEDSLIRGSLLHVEDDEHVLLLTMHHIVSDGWSLGILFRELGSCYAAFSRGEDPVLPELPLQYVDFSIWQRQWLTGRQLDRQLNYWSRQLAALQVLDLPTDKTRPIIQTYDGAYVSCSIDEQLSDQLERLSKESGVTLFMTLLAVFMIMLHRYSGQDDIVIGSPIANRNRAEFEGLIAFFVNMLVMRVDCSGNPDFNTLVKRVRDVALGAYEHQDIPFERLVDVLQVERDPSRNPLFQVQFAFQDAPLETLELPGLTLEPVIDETRIVHFDLECYVSQQAQGLEIRILYNTNLFEAATVNRMLEHYHHLLEQVVANPDQAIDLLPMLGSDEKLLLQRWNRTNLDYPPNLTIPQLIETQVERSPAAIAIEFAEQSLSYLELDQRANELALRLQDKGIGPDRLVGVYMLRSLEMVIALYAVLKAGGAYVPLDPEYPHDRIAHMAEEAQLSVILTQQHIRQELPDTGAVVICVDRNQLKALPGPPGLRSAGASADDLAYVIYTSGSTGKPKGVMNCHRGVVNRLLWGQQTYPLGEDDRVMQKTPFSFDVSVWEIFWPLMSGARLVIAKPEGHKDPVYLSRLIRDQGINHLHFVPSMLKVFLDNTDASDFSQVKRVFCSGEALSYELQQQFFKLGNAELHNLYGPTEAAIEVSYWACRPDDNRRVVPIGRPVANTQLHILDRHMQPVPIGVGGELYIGGIQVAEGYLGQPELTAERFIPDPFSDRASARLYKTGDLVRYLADGEILYLGRADNQVKLRGFRIEPGEVEAELLGIEGVKGAVVVAHQGKSGDKRLVAYLVMADKDGEPINYIREQLKKRLPDYMVPSVFMPVENIALNSNGKVDYKKLPEPEVSRHVSMHLIAPTGQFEKSIVQIWKQVLNLEKIGVEDNFFDLGGDSFSIIQLHTALEETLAREIPVTDLFRFTTIQSFARQYESNRGSSADRRARLETMASKQRAAMRKKRRISSHIE